MTLSITTLYHYAEYRCAECHLLFIVKLNVIMLSVIMLIVIMLSVVVPQLGYLSVNFLVKQVPGRSPEQREL
jgi:hypothetical protein